MKDDHFIRCLEQSFRQLESHLLDHCILHRTLFSCAYSRSLLLLLLLVQYSIEEDVTDEIHSYFRLMSPVFNNILLEKSRNPAHFPCISNNNLKHQMERLLEFLDTLLALSSSNQPASI